jgi:hypothetical protein
LFCIPHGEKGNICLVFGGRSASQSWLCFENTREASPTTDTGTHSQTSLGVHVSLSGQNRTTEPGLAKQRPGNPADLEDKSAALAGVQWTLAGQNGAWAWESLGQDGRKGSWHLLPTQPQGVPLGLRRLQGRGRMALCLPRTRLVTIVQVFSWGWGAQRTELIEVVRNKVLLSTAENRREISPELISFLQYG